EGFVSMFEFDVHRQNSIRAILKEEDGIRFKPFAAFDPACATVVASAPVVRPEWLLGRLRPPPHRALLIDESDRSDVARRDRRARDQPISDIL
ncbi:MAG TPA: hypothetical protein VD863_20015, partial [Bradyrhizobium sp.]|nr:hypothetical protein [Bradyrhizobium sp.]